ncbi:hypothetical protein IU501_33135 [Nocardia otitidiscaviarum]|uniref:hypothetical protein n=1 Tax=Nocardia otitidiscaviarum TaxID=1823 RepID=UPI0004A6CCE1|nr:hypothetical protein [Nocardia otitidiscaviarum]MBF6137817.1 hypothetical protein [Nocardia otitidiscaviarum]MBF6485340.1 hypothetical protein [Nocardia otitidiscaviarum]
MDDLTTNYPEWGAPVPLAPPAPTTRVAVRAVTSGIVGVGCEHTEAWRFVTIPAEALGCYDYEADAITTALEGRSWVGDVIALDTVIGCDAQQFTAGCSTWTVFSSDVSDDPDHALPERRRAELGHWNCEHALFGGRPTEGWATESDPDELLALAVLERWTFGTAGFRAFAQRPEESPNVVRLTVFRDGAEPLCEDVAFGTAEAAKETAVAMIVGAITADQETRLPTYAERVAALPRPLPGSGVVFTARIATDDTVETEHGPAQHADIVITADGQPDPVATYSLTSSPLDPLPDGPADVLARHGWRMAEPGHLDADHYLLVRVERA